MHFTRNAAAHTLRLPALPVHRPHSEEYVAKMKAEWGKRSPGELIDVEQLFSLSEHCWHFFLCDANGNSIPLPTVDRIRLQGKLITRSVPCSCLLRAF
jgi:hypothetical protein